MERALCPVLIGREKELTLLEDALLAANRGDGQVLVLAGEAGLGKSRLATELQRRALKGGTVVLWGGCSEADLALPYLPFLEAIGNYLARADVEEVKQQLGTVRRELAQLFPQLESEAISHDTGDPTQSKLRLFEAVLRLLRIPSDEHGLLLVVEDLHWADGSTRELLDYMTRRLRNTRILVVATYRSDELHRKHPLLPMVQGWRRSQVAQIVQLDPLPAAQVASMVSAIFDGETVGTEFRDFIHDRSEGNPFVLEELLKAALDRGDIYRTPTGWDRKALAELRIPPSVRDTILMRVERLTEEQAEILRVAAVLGTSFAYSTLAAVAGRDKTTVQNALHAFVQQQLMVEEPTTEGHYRFRHALTREAIYEDLIVPKRADLHAQAAEALRRLPGTQAVDLAYHLLAAGQWDEAIPMCLKAAEEAQRRRGYREAVDLYIRALPHLKDRMMRGQVLCRLGFAHWATGETGKAKPNLEEGVSLLEEAGQKREAASYRLWLGRCHWESSRPDLARVEYERARIALEPSGPSEDLANAYVRLAGLHLFAHEGPETLAMGRRAVAVAEAAKADAPRIWAYNFIGSTLVADGDFEEGFDYLDRAYKEAASLGLDWITANALYNDINIKMTAFRGREALKQLEILRSLGARSPSYVLVAEGWLDLHVLGEPQSALQALEQAAALALEAQNLTVAAWARGYLATALAALGRFEEAVRVLPKVTADTEHQDALEVAYTETRIGLDAGDIAAAVRAAETTASLMPQPTALLHSDIWFVDKAVEAFIRTGEISAAEELIERAHQAARKRQHPFTARMEGRLALAKGNLEKARDYFAEAVRALEEVDYRDDEWRTRRALADVKARLGDHTGAETELRAVLAVAQQHGHLFEAESARKQLAELGVTVGRPAEPSAATEDIRQPSERLVTVLFVDVRGYTTMTAKESPQVMVDRLQAFLRWSQQEIERHHGLVDQYAGDAVMATFNVSGVRLDHCLHALQAAIAIRDKANYGGLPVGIGIAVGPAVVGQLAEGMKVTAVGDTTNLASRLQAQAAAGEILLTDEAYRRTRTWLNQQKLATTEHLLSLKGFAEPVVAHRLTTAMATAP